MTNFWIFSFFLLFIAPTFQWDCGKYESPTSAILDIQGPLTEYDEKAVCNDGKWVNFLRFYFVLFFRNSSFLLLFPTTTTSLLLLFFWPGWGRGYVLGVPRRGWMVLWPGELWWEVGWDCLPLWPPSLHDLKFHELHLPKGERWDGRWNGDKWDILDI